ncbi:sensor histidine kinase [Epibacterium sp. SM1979]|uniref:histidine kinase n=1 Tax=Tritonibacter litoralis TaxID=2662264 RepID=A0A843YN35_9RHOB|nr:sensor histidine kinase [Tritonibacter litoralis]
MSVGPRRKWRPRLWVVVVVVLGLVLCLPFAGLLLFKFYANQLVQQTEESLLSQASILSALYADAFSEVSGETEELIVPDQFSPIFPALSLRDETILPPRPDAVEGRVDPSAIHKAIGPRLSKIAEISQTGTLAGYRFLDPAGNVIGGSAEVGLSLSNVGEVTRALQGETVSVARVRIRTEKEPLIYDLSRGTRVRIFVTMPTLVNGEIIGAVYVSRTPNHIFRFLYGERFNLVKAGLFVLLATGLIGLVFWRFITRPIHALIRQTTVSEDGRWSWQSFDHLGTREIENLSNSFQALTARLQAQQDSLRSYTAHVTHELKSPLTAAKGAAELLRDKDMSDKVRSKFLDNIDRDIDRMEALLNNMRAFAISDQVLGGGHVKLAEVIDEVRRIATGLEVEIGRDDCEVPLNKEALMIVLTHLVENAAQHSATQVKLECVKDAGVVKLIVADNGVGISEGNRDKIFTPFFTTRRETGGTGMGLNTAKSIVETLGGTIELMNSETGAIFHTTFD